MNKRIINQSFALNKMMQRTLVLVKPDGVMRGLVGECIKRFEQRGLKIIGMKMTQADSKLAGSHYGEDIANRHGEHVRKALLDYIKMGPVVAMVIEGIHAIDAVRKIAGATYPGEAIPGTIRGDFTHISKEYAKAENRCYNIIHSSANPEEAKSEIALWFGKKELHSYRTANEAQVM
jgi:nucleoside-diphosphate kinase